MFLRHDSKLIELINVLQSLDFTRLDLLWDVVRDIKNNY